MSDKTLTVEQAMKIAAADVLNDTSGYRGRLMSRQSDLIPARVRHIAVAIVGLGAIGSNVADTLASMGIMDFILYDPDEVEMENIYPGRFTMLDIGMSKVAAVKQHLVDDLGLNPALILTRADRFNSGNAVNANVYVVCTDDMESRRYVWDAAGRGPIGGRCNAWIDARMGGTSASVYTISNDDVDGPTLLEQTNAYEKRLQVETQPLPCGEKATSPITKAMVPLMVAQSVMDHLNNRCATFGRSFDLQNGRLISYNV